MVKLEALTDKKDWLLKIAEWRNHPCSRPVLLTSHQTSPLKQGEWIERIKEHAEYFYFIVDEDKGVDGVIDKLVGYCGLIKINNVSRTAEISILLNPEEARRGAGSLAVKELLGVAFNELNLNTVYAECYDNTGRWEFFEQCGFTLEGILRNRKFWKGYHNSIIGSITYEEYHNNTSKDG